MMIVLSARYYNKMKFYWDNWIGYQYEQRKGKS
jgi:hypothetical protein